MTTSRTILWQRLDLPGHEIGRLGPRADGWELSGTAVFAHDGLPCKLDYLVVYDARWCTQSAEIRGVVGDRDVELVVSVDDDRGRWCLNGVESPAVEGCTDIDLGFSPSTNLLPIRRLALAVGEEAEVRAAWLPFPSLAFEVLLVSGSTSSRRMVGGSLTTATKPVGTRFTSRPFQVRDGDGPFREMAESILAGARMAPSCSTSAGMVVFTRSPS